jgi:DNA-directed RNA polymerase subunit RPC12/RpoP
MKKLISLEENNKFFNTFQYENVKVGNGIACPNCGEELIDSDNYILTSNPPQRNVKCLKCDFKSFRNC